MSARRRVSVVIPVYNEEAGLPALFARLYPALDALGVAYEIIFVNDGSRDRSAALLREQFRTRPDVTRVDPVQRQLRPAHGDHGRLRARAAASASSRSTPTCRIRPRRSASCSREMDEGHDYVGAIRRMRQDACVAALGLARDEPAARAHHAHPDDRPGLHAARLQPRRSSTRSRAAREVNTFIPALAYTFAHNPDRGRGRARGARAPASRSTRSTS